MDHMEVLQLKINELFDEADKDYDSLSLEQWRELFYQAACAAQIAINSKQRDRTSRLQAK